MPRADQGTVCSSLMVEVAVKIFLKTRPDSPWCSGGFLLPGPACRGCGEAQGVRQGLPHRAAGGPGPETKLGVFCLFVCCLMLPDVVCVSLCLCAAVLVFE